MHSTLFSFLIQEQQTCPFQTAYRYHHNTIKIILKQLFPKKFHHFGPMTSSCPSKQHFGEFQPLFADIGLVLNYKMDITPMKPRWILFIILKILFWNKYSPIFSLFWPYDVILTPKNALFEHFERFLKDFRLFHHYNIEIIL